MVERVTAWLILWIHQFWGCLQAWVSPVVQTGSHQSGTKRPLIGPHYRLPGTLWVALAWARFPTDHLALYGHGRVIAPTRAENPALDYLAFCGEGRSR